MMSGMAPRRRSSGLVGKLFVWVISVVENDLQVKYDVWESGRRLSLRSISIEIIYLYKIYRYILVVFI
jgi:hypothetical protein